MEIARGEWSRSGRLKLVQMVGTSNTKVPPLELERMRGTCRKCLPEKRVAYVML